MVLLGKLLHKLVITVNVLSDLVNYTVKDTLLAHFCVLLGHHRYPLVIRADTDVGPSVAGKL